MKNRGKYLIYICNIILTGLIVFNITTYDLEKREVSISLVDSSEGKYVSYLEIDNIKKDLLEEKIVNESLEEEKVEEKDITPVVKEEVKKEETVVIEVPKEEVKQEVVKEEIKQEEPKEEVKPTETVIETLVGNLVGYGPDCYGCTSMKTASGKYIGEGNIYYNDATYGKVRIVAGDYSYPFGTIVKISNVDFYNDEPFYAVVLDRGGNIGKGKKFLFDLLFASESEASRLGKEVNIKYEIMRLGY